jgi:hypothetical protein
MENYQVKRLIFVVAIAAFILSACGTKAVPTTDPVQLQATAIAMVSTYAAMTQAAATPTPMPTDTPLPSPTPLPSLTPLPIPTLPALETVLPAGAPTKDPCDAPLGGGPAAAADAGKVRAANILIVNDTKATITFSLYLVKNVYGQCGYTSYVLSRGDSIFLANVLPLGCYYSNALINDPKKPTHVSNGPTCITGNDKTTFTVTMERLKVTGP